MTTGLLIVISLLLLAVIALQTLTRGEVMTTRDDIQGELAGLKAGQTQMTAILAKIRADVDRLASNIPALGGLTEEQALQLKEDLKQLAGTATGNVAEAAAIDTLTPEPEPPPPPPPVEEPPPAPPAEEPPPAAEESTSRSTSRRSR